VSTPTPALGAFSQSQNLPSKFSILANASLKRFSEEEVQLYDR